MVVTSLSIYMNYIKINAMKFNKIYQIDCTLFMFNYYLFTPLQ
jgi:hypothetical protein